MKAFRFMLASLVVLYALNAAVAAQEKVNVVVKADAGVPVKILVVLTEYDGDKKVSSMPYTLSGLATADRSRNNASLRMGLRVPIMTSTKEGQSQLQYQDVGTDIDARVEPQSDSRFNLWMQIRRSSVHTLEGTTKETAWTMGEGSGRPILRSFSAGFEGFIVRDGQAAQTATATDPVSGRVLKVEVTITSVK